MGEFQKLTCENCSQVVGVPPEKAEEFDEDCPECGASDWKTHENTKVQPVESKQTSDEVKDE